METRVWNSKCMVILYQSPTGHMVAYMHIVNFTIKPTVQLHFDFDSTVIRLLFHSHPTARVFLLKLYIITSGLILYTISSTCYNGFHDNAFYQTDPCIACKEHIVCFTNSTSYPPRHGKWVDIVTGWLILSFMFNPATFLGRLMFLCFSFFLYCVYLLYCVYILCRF